MSGRSLSTAISLTGILAICQPTATSPLELTTDTDQVIHLDEEIVTLPHPTTQTAPINPYGAQILEHAEEHLGKKYAWPSGPNTMHCLDLVFESLSATFNESRRLYSVDPRDMVKNPYLGKPVEGLSPILREDLNEQTFQLFQPGDVIYFLFENYDRYAPINDPMRTHVTRINGIGYGGWHVGLSAGGNRIIHASPGNQVQFDTISSDANFFTVPFDALWVSRRDEKNPNKK